MIKDELEASGQSVALVSRSGIDLSRFGMRYSHAGISLKASDNAPWSVRQLYYDCEQSRPRIYDQGVAGFVLGTDEPALGFVSIVFLPRAEAAALESAALDKRRALEMLDLHYSANAYPFSLRYQNCNQWVIELMATAWGAAPGGAESRRQAQDWLRSKGYQSSLFEVVWFPLIWWGELLPWLHTDDHPREDLAQARFRVSMPASIEAFVHEQAPTASRVEICHSATQVVVHRGWQPIDAGCSPAPGDRVFELD